MDKLAYCACNLSFLWCFSNEMKFRLHDFHGVWFGIRVYGWLTVYLAFRARRPRGVKPKAVITVKTFGGHCPLSKQCLNLVTTFLYVGSIIFSAFCKVASTGRALQAVAYEVHDIRHKSSAKIYLARRHCRDFCI